MCYLVHLCVVSVPAISTPCLCQPSFLCDYLLLPIASNCLPSSLLYTPLFPFIFCRIVVYPCVSLSSLRLLVEPVSFDRGLNFRLYLFACENPFVHRRPSLSFLTTILPSVFVPLPDHRLKPLPHYTSVESWFWSPSHCPVWHILRLYIAIVLIQETTVAALVAVLL